jgi:hypothetical protein
MVGNCCPLALRSIALPELGIIGHDTTLRFMKPIAIAGIEQTLLQTSADHSDQPFPQPNTNEPDALNLYAPRPDSGNSP